MHDLSTPHMKKITLCVLAASVLALLSCKQDAPQWSPAGDHIMTTWGEEVTPENVHPEYPRPQLVRGNWMSLNGLWDYAVTGKDAAQPENPDGQILVPFAIESALSGVGRTFTENDALWYKTEFKRPASWKNKRVLLNFEAVDWSAEVFVNGKKAGDHTGAYTHFSFDITPLLNKGAKQEIVVKVLDGTDNNFQPRGKQVKNPRGIWYTAVSGIWQSVWAEAVDQAYVSDYNVVSSVADGSVAVTVDVDGAAPGDQVEVSVIEGGVGFSTESVSAGAKTLASASGNPGSPITIKVPDAKCWSPDSPWLYGLRFKLVRGGKTLDEATGYTAIREIASKVDAQGHKRFALNGRQIFMLGPLDQGWWPDGLHTAPSDAALKFDIEKTRDLGFNMIRKHIKVEPSRWYYYCDQLGIMVWQDMPSFGVHDGARWERVLYNAGTDFAATPEAKANYRKEWSEIIAQQKKFPCTVVWVPFNEAWSQFDTPEIIDFTHNLDPTRLINMASGGNWWTREDGSKVGDIMDAHNYPEPRMRLVDPDLINVVGEYGGIGLPVEGHLWQADKNWGYVKFNGGDEVLAKYTDYANILKGLISEIGCSGGVYTQTTDVEIEINGLMTYDRKVVKVDQKKVHDVNQEVIKAGSE